MAFSVKYFCLISASMQPIQSLAEAGYQLAIVAYVSVMYLASG